MVSLLLLVAVTGCSRSVPAQQIVGTYIARYPFGNAKLILSGDGTFVQTVSVGQQSPAVAHGSWQFDARRSKITLRGAMPVVDGSGHLQTDWRTTDELPEQPVERVWFKIEIESSNDYPYVKQ